VFRNIELLDPEEPVEGLPTKPTIKDPISHLLTPLVQRRVLNADGAEPDSESENGHAEQNPLLLGLYLRSDRSESTCTVLTCFSEEFQDFFDNETLLTSLSGDALHKIIRPKKLFQKAIHAGCEYCIPYTVCATTYSLVVSCQDATSVTDNCSGGTDMYKLGHELLVTVL